MKESLMRFIRYQNKKEEIHFGWVFEDRVGPLTGSPLAEYRKLDASLLLEKVTLLAPIIPTKIVCIARNYKEHAKEQGVEVPAYPTLFMKPITSIIGPKQTIILPPQSQQIEYEAELGVVIGKRGRWITAEKANQYIFGFTIVNDVTARDLQQRDGQWTRAKGFDTFCPLGPWIETELDVTDIMISTYINGELRQMGSTRDMVFSISQLIAYISSIMTLEPGDLILTGTPAGVGPIRAGDRIEIKIDGIGKLENSVAEDKKVVK